MKPKRQHSDKSVRSICSSAGYCPKHTERVIFAPRKSRRAWCAMHSVLAQVLKHRVLFPERRIESLAVCMAHMDKRCSNFYAKDLSLNAARQRLRCA